MVPYHDRRLHPVAIRGGLAIKQPQLAPFFITRTSFFIKSGAYFYWLIGGSRNIGQRLRKL